MTRAPKNPVFHRLLDVIHQGDLRYVKCVCGRFFGPVAKEDLCAATEQWKSHPVEAEVADRDRLRELRNQRSIAIRRASIS